MKRAYHYFIRYWKTEPRNKSGRRYYRVESPAFPTFESCNSNMRSIITSLGYQGFGIDSYHIESFLAVESDIVESDIIPY